MLLMISLFAKENILKYTHDNIAGKNIKFILPVIIIGSVSVLGVKGLIKSQLCKDNINAKDGKNEDNSHLKDKKEVLNSKNDSKKDNNIDDVQIIPIQITEMNSRTFTLKIDQNSRVNEKNNTLQSELSQQTSFNRTTIQTKERDILSNAWIDNNTIDKNMKINDMIADNTIEDNVNTNNISSTQTQSISIGQNIIDQNLNPSLNIVLSLENEVESIVHIKTIEHNVVSNQQLNYNNTSIAENIYVEKLEEKNVEKFQEKNNTNLVKFNKQKVLKKLNHIPVKKILTVIAFIFLGWNTRSYIIDLSIEKTDNLMDYTNQITDNFEVQNMIEINYSLNLESNNNIKENTTKEVVEKANQIESEIEGKNRSKTIKSQSFEKLIKLQTLEKLQNSSEKPFRKILNYQDNLLSKYSPRNQVTKENRDQNSLEKKLNNQDKAYIEKVSDITKKENVMKLAGSSDLVKNFVRYSFYPIAKLFYDEILCNQVLQNKVLTILNPILDMYIYISLIRAFLISYLFVILIPIILYIYQLRANYLLLGFMKNYHIAPWIAYIKRLEKEIIFCEQTITKYKNTEVVLDTGKFSNSLETRNTIEDNKKRMKSIHNKLVSLICAAEKNVDWIKNLKFHSMMKIYYQDKEIMDYLYYNERDVAAYPQNDVNSLNNIVEKIYKEHENDIVSVGENIESHKKKILNNLLEKLRLVVRRAALSVTHASVPLVAHSRVSLVAATVAAPKKYCYFNQMFGYIDENYRQMILSRSKANQLRTGLLTRIWRFNPFIASQENLITFCKKSGKDIWDETKKIENIIQGTMPTFPKVFTHITSISSSIAKQITDDIKGHIEVRADIKTSGLPLGNREVIMTMLNVEMNNILNSYIIPSVIFFVPVIRLYFKIRVKELQYITNLSLSLSKLSFYTIFAIIFTPVKFFYNLYIRTVNRDDDYSKINKEKTLIT